MSGMRRGRREDARFLTGQGRYVADLRFEGLLHAAFARCPHASAELAGLDVEAARAAPGVVAVLTGAELEADGVAPFSAPMKVEGPEGEVWEQTPKPFLIPVGGRVRHAGEPVAMVIAETAEDAEAAAEAVEAEYVEGPVVASRAAAKAQGASRVWEDRPDNRAFVWAKGDWEAAGAALADCAHVARLDTAVSRVEAATMEPRAATGVPAAERTTLYASHQGAQGLRGALARVLGLEAEAVHVVAPDVGGSFGMKSGPLREEILVFWAARRLGAPVRWVATRSEAMLSDEPGRDIGVEAELGLDAEGRFRALRVRMSQDAGAYASARSLFMVNNFGGVSGVYDIPLTAGRVEGWFTNTAPTAPYRGAGRPEATFAIERVIDRAARLLGVEPFELRRRNLVQPEAMPWDTGLLFRYDSGDFPAVMAAAAERADLAGFEARRAESAARGKLRGLGIANCIEVAGGPFGVNSPDFSFLEVSPEGRVRLGSGVMSAGQGLGTAMVGLAAEALGLPEDAFDYVQGDTDPVPKGKGMGGSAAMTTGAPALRDGAEKLVARAKELAAEALEVAPADLEYAAGEVRVAGTDRAMSLGEIARHAQAAGAALAAAGEFKPADSTFPNGCHVAEVEIDPETGACAAVRYAAVEDIGPVLFPQLAEGQVHGGVAQALGQVFGEAVAHDADGQMLSASFMDYAMPRAADLPDYDCGFFEGAPTSLNPFGVKGVGEAGSVGGLAAGMNAVCDALARAGAEEIDMPASPARVWAALSAAR
ncbi:MAG: xanthine dehydrogenase family protein molybdopterin-binding subunit [Pseudomonadota bacterium]